MFAALRDTIRADINRQVGWANDEVRRQARAILPLTRAALETRPRAAEVNLGVEGGGPGAAR
jgi:hypothetical protein